MESEEKLKDFRKSYLLKMLIFHIISKVIFIYFMLFNFQEKPNELDKVGIILILQMRK